MKKPIVLFAALVLAGAMHAQDAPQRDAGKMAKHRSERMAKELQLNAEQTQRLETLFTKHMEQMQQMRRNHEAEMKAVLTPEQYAKWQQLKQERRDKMREKRQGQGSRGQGPARGGDGNNPVR